MEHSKKNLEEELQKTEVVSWEGLVLLLVGADCRHPQAFTRTALEDLARECSVMTYKPHIRYKSTACAEVSFRLTNSCWWFGQMFPATKQTRINTHDEFSQPCKKKNFIFSQLNFFVKIP